MASKSVASDSELVSPSTSVKKKYGTVYNESYTEEFSCILRSRKDSHHVFCNVCGLDFSIFHKGKGDITKHISREKHQSALQAATKSQKLDLNFLQKTDDFSVIRAESLFTAYLVEHNLAVSAADHAGSLFKKMFPDSNIAKKYGCARTKTTAIIEEMAKNERMSIIDDMRRSPFAISTDGSNKGDLKLYPIVVTYNCSGTKQIETSLLSVPVLEGSGTGENISNLILNVLSTYDIPFENCLSFGADNCPTMIGRNTGVAGFLLKEMPSLFIQGCLCHLINLAAEKGAACLPINIEELVIDIYYYLEKSTKRKEKLKKFQLMHDLEVKKILKHVSTRWLSLSRCLKRLIEQWDPLTSFFREEAQKKLDEKISSNSKLKDYQIPKRNKVVNTQSKESSVPVEKKRKISVVTQSKESSVPVEKKRKISVVTQSKESSVSLGKKRKTSVVTSVSSVAKKTKILAKNTGLPKKEILSREERLFMFLSSKVNKAFVHFLLNTLPLFEENNADLQSKKPQIHVLHSMIMEMFKCLLSRFVAPSVIKNAKSLLEVNYHLLKNQKLNSDIMIGQASLSIISSLSEKKQTLFYKKVREYYIKVCDYMRFKFPFADEIITNAAVADLDRIDEMKFEQIAYFVKRFPAIQKSLGNDEGSILDELQSQFCSVQVENIPASIKAEERMDRKWMQLCDSYGGKYSTLSKFMMSILSLPHSNAECERIFSYVTKTQTQFRSQLSAQTLSNLLTVKSNMTKSCYEHNFDNDFLKKAKSASTRHNSNYTNKE